MKNEKYTALSIVVEFTDLFDEIPKSINEYLGGIPNDILLNYAIYYCSLSTKLEPTINNILFPFIRESDKNTKYYNNLCHKISCLVNEKSPNPTILNVRSSLKLFELVKGRSEEKSLEYTDTEVRQILFKVYLLLNANNCASESPNFNKLVLSNSLIYVIYSDTNLYYLRITELIKSCIFLEYCENQYPDHLKIFLTEYGLEKWQDYIAYLHQIGMLIINSDIQNPVTLISIPECDKNYEKKSSFLQKFCIQETYQNDQDYTLIKSFPLEKDNVTDKYRVVFEEFFIEKIYRSLYFKFNEINKALKGSDSYFKNFRSDFGLRFSEQELLNKILKDSLGKKYKHRSYRELIRDGSIDYYIRDGKNIFLFECKDNLINKKVIETGDVDVFIDEMQHIFLQNKEGSDKAIKQIINNIEVILNGNFSEDSGINPYTSIIYPIIVVHNNIFSLPGVNALLDDWFKEELNSRQIKNKNIKNLTIIDIDTLVLYQGVISQKSTSLKRLIDLFWDYINNKSNKKYATEESTVIGLLQKKLSFRDYIVKELDNINIFTKEITKYDKYFKE